MTPRTRATGDRLRTAMVSLVLGAAMVRCGGLIDIPSPPAANDAGHPADATVGGSDAGLADGAMPDVETIDGANTDACAVTSDWPGFRRVTELDPCIQNDVLVDPDAGFALAWADCDAGIPGCKSVQLLQTDPSWNPPGTDNNVYAYATHDDAGSGADLMLVQENSSQPYFRDQFDVFDVKTQTRVAEWRDQVDDPQLLYQVRPVSIEGPNHLTAYFATVHSGELATFGSAASLGSSNPMSTSWTPFVPTTSIGWVAPDWTLLYASPTYCVNATGHCGPHAEYPDGGIGLTTEVAWRDVMFGYTSWGGWLAEVALFENDPSVLLRAVPSTHVWGFRTDGIDMVWNESVGDPNIINDQTTTEVWAAPYTVDATTLGATARKVATLGPGRIGPFAIYFNGMFAFVYAYDVYVVDVLTGQSQVVPMPAGYHPISLAYVDHSAVWEVVSTVSYHYTFVSIPLAAQ